MSFLELFNFYYVSFHSYETITIRLSFLKSVVCIILEVFFFNFYIYIEIRKKNNNGTKDSSKISSMQIAFRRMSKKVRSTNTSDEQYASSSRGNSQVGFIRKINIIFILHSIQRVDEEIIQ